MQNENLHEEITCFIKQCKSILIASLNLNKECICSYAPIIKVENEFFIYISEIAQHYECFANNADNIEIMFIEDEKDAFSILARKRLKFRVKALEVSRNDAKFNYVLSYFEKENPQEEAIKIIKNMHDFHLFQLILKNGRYVKGFGKAYEIKGENISLINSHFHR
ncbi:heme oxygenase, HugZ family [Campylobacter peloridis]|uniref:Heme oxygenase, HugZ family n=1 Tax=Campylobacter peloridis TaxID=488546 RepID=A0ABX6TSZ9_9BACT|nr:heme oxygenase, HugZ family [Campylobacter peloridis]AJC84324.1 heme oxygenase, HugZ family [Campylobacter peloridis LMG 23910]QOQ88423.1 heme oxygenase, HugZ family [Campylobacter peloridis]